MIPKFRLGRFVGTTWDVAKDLLILPVELSGKSSHDSYLRRSNVKRYIAFTDQSGKREARHVPNGFDIDGGISDENGDSVLLLVARGVPIGAAAARR